MAHDLGRTGHDHNADAGHSHDASADAERGKLAVALTLIAGFMIFEVLVGDGGRR